MNILKELCIDLSQRPGAYVKFAINKGVAVFAAWCIAETALEDLEKDNLVSSTLGFTSAFLLLNMFNSVLSTAASTVVEEHLNRELVDPTSYDTLFARDTKSSLPTKLVKEVTALPLIVGATFATLAPFKAEEQATWEISLLTRSTGVLTYLAYELMFETLLEESRKEGANFRVSSATYARFKNFLSACSKSMEDKLKSSCRIPIKLIGTGFDFFLNTLAAQSVGEIVATWVLPATETQTAYDISPDRFNATAGEFAMLTFSLLKSAKEPWNNVLQYMIFFSAGLPATIACYKWAGETDISRWQLQFAATAVGGLVSQLSFPYYFHQWYSFKQSVQTTHFCTLAKSGLIAIRDHVSSMTLSVISSGITYQLFKKVLRLSAEDAVSFSIAVNIFATWCLDATLSKQPLTTHSYSSFLGRQLPAYSVKQMAWRMPAWLFMPAVACFYAKTGLAWVPENSVAFNARFDPKHYLLLLLTTRLLTGLTGEATVDFCRYNLPAPSESYSSCEQRSLSSIRYSAEKAISNTFASSLEKGIKGINLLFVSYCFGKTLTETVMEDSNHLALMLMMQLSNHVITTIKLESENQLISWAATKYSLTNLALKLPPTLVCWGILRAIEILSKEKLSDTLLLIFAMTFPVIPEGFEWTMRSNFDFFKPLSDEDGQVEVDITRNYGAIEEQDAASESALQINYHQ